MNSVEEGLTFISVAKWNFDKHARFPGHESVVDESEEGPLQSSECPRTIWNVMKKFSNFT